jgi:hypothetical protein
VNYSDRIFTREARFFFLKKNRSRKKCSTPGIKRQLGELKQRYGNEKEALLTEIGDLKKETQELRAHLATKEAEHEQW